MPGEKLNWNQVMLIVASVIIVIGAIFVAATFLPPF